MTTAGRREARNDLAGRLVDVGDVPGGYEGSIAASGVHKKAAGQFLDNGPEAAVICLGRTLLSDDPVVEKMKVD